MVSFDHVIGPSQVWICHPNLAVSGVSTSGASCTLNDRPETTLSSLPALANISLQANGHSVVSTDPDRLLFFRGLFYNRLASGVHDWFDTTTQGTSANPTQVYAESFQPSGYSRGQLMRSGPAAQMDQILDNLGVGLTTFDGALEDTTAFYWLNGGTTLFSGSDARNYYGKGDGAATQVWTALSPGMSLPQWSTATNAFNTSATLSPPTSGATTEYRVVGPAVPSRVSYVRIQWDWLWHGTCTKGGTPRWCLPDGHPRISADLNGAIPGGSILNASVSSASDHCATACTMVCPTAAGGSNQVKYDFKLLLDQLDAVSNVGTTTAIPVVTASGAGSTFEGQIAQRLALRVMPYSNYKYKASGGWWRSLSPPQWLFSSDPATFAYNPSAPTGCQLESDRVRTGVDDFDTTSGTLNLSWNWVEPFSAVYRDQVDLLADALAVGSSPNVDVGARAFAGLRGDGRVFSIDVGPVGSYGEWNVDMPPVQVSGGGSATLSAARGLRLATAYDATTAPTGWNPNCESGSTHTIRANSWWAQILNTWYDAFPATLTSSASPYSGWPSTQLVAKLSYSTSLALQNASQNPQCYDVAAYAHGLRGTGTTGLHGWDGAYHGSGGNAPDTPMGVRWDSWGYRELTDYYPADQDTWATGGQTPADWGDSDRWASNQAELYNFPVSLFAYAHPTLYKIWDLDEAIRYAVAAHVSLFNLKSRQFPAAPRSAFPPTSINDLQVFDSDLCTCSGASASCLGDYLRRLVTRTGYRVRLASKSFRSPIPTQTSMLSLTARFVNDGNQPPLSAYQLQVAFVDRSQFDWNNASKRRPFHVFPNDAWGPPATSPDLATLITNQGGVQNIAVSGFDPRKLTPAQVLDPSSVADWSTVAGTGACQPYYSVSTINTVTGSTWAGTSPSAYVYPTATAPRWHTLRFHVTPPANAGSYVILIRFDDLSVVGSPVGYRQPVPLEMPTLNAVGDTSSVRWYALGYLDVDP